jgi:hypothetical protein
MFLTEEDSMKPLMAQNLTMNSSANKGSYYKGSGGINDNSPNQQYEIPLPSDSYEYLL